MKKQIINTLIIATISIGLIACGKNAEYAVEKQEIGEPVVSTVSENTEINEEEKHIQLIDLFLDYNSKEIIVEENKEENFVKVSSIDNPDLYFTIRYEKENTANNFCSGLFYQTGQDKDFQTKTIGNNIDALFCSIPFNDTLNINYYVINSFEGIYIIETSNDINNEILQKVIDTINIVRQDT